MFVVISDWTRQSPCRSVSSPSRAVHLGHDTGSARQSPFCSVSMPKLAVHLGNDTELNVSNNDDIINYTGSSYLPKVNSESSSRVRAAFTAHAVSSLLMTGKAKRKLREKINIRNRKLNDDLICFQIFRFSPIFTLEYLKSHDVFVDGGKQGNDPISPNVNSKRQIVVLTVKDHDILQQDDHIIHPEMGLRLVVFKNTTVLIPPRLKCLTSTGLLSSLSAADKLCDAIDALSGKVHISLKRGIKKHICSKHKYICVGTYPPRGSMGIVR